MKIEVEPRGWGDALPVDIEALLTDVASHLNRLLVEPVAERIMVVPVSGTGAVPRTLYRYSASGPVTIQLTARDKRWAKFAYQFAHEFCHVLSGYERLRRWSQQLVARSALRIGVRIHPPAHGGALADDVTISKLGGLRGCFGQVTQMTSSLTKTGQLPSEV